VDERLKAALSAVSEHSALDFKAAFDPKDGRERCEIVKDIVAMTNSGGGVILFGVDDSGQIANTDTRQLPSLDPASVTDWIYKYTHVQFGEIEVCICDKDGCDVVALVIDPSVTPLVFAKPGTYDTGNGKQMTAFGQGTVYFRHGAKSEPGTTDDLRALIERAKENAREALKEGLRQVIEAPSGSRIMIVEGNAEHGVRLVDDEYAEPVRTISPDITHPYRQKELISEVRARIPTIARFNQYDVQCIKWAYDAEQNPTYCYRSALYGVVQYSDGFLAFIVNMVRQDPRSLEDLRDKFYRRQK
jgi:hypothetical protein